MAASASGVTVHTGTSTQLHYKTHRLALGLRTVRIARLRPYKMCPWAVTVRDHRHAIIRDWLGLSA